MTNDELFPTLEVKNTEQTKFKTSIYFKPKQDFRINVPHDMHIIRATETSNLFMLPGQRKTDAAKGCSSFDRITGYDKVKKEKVECEECPYRNRKDHKGLTIKEDDGNEVTYKCSNTYSIFMEHPDADKEYVLANVNWKVYIEFMKYRNTLLSRGLDVPDVITRVTRVEPLEGNGYMYEFEFVEECNIGITEDEQKLIDEIRLKLDEKVTIEYVAGILNEFAKVRNVTMDMNRATKLATSLSDGQYVHPVE